ncbi:PDR/VanB family oxidoreductase [Halomonas denitrificans]|uniref:PDR/VanB family oxidoreductase n=1 Tax=Halomonas TaxID=2745 RepID=UPI001C9A15AB|nr:PDR/VanB family oxidoreductase [Halomonas denitrificans]MBY5969637.1 PDR/VanB family oxidoreductase [Halomonas denitrificans]
MPTAETRLTLTVRRIRQLTPTIKAFELVSPDGQTLPTFTPGAHLKVEVQLADGSRDERAYSLVNSQDPTSHYEIAVQLEPESRGGSAYMHGLQEGVTVGASCPRNDFPLAQDGTHHVLIAGGIGITPILSMAAQLQAQGASYEMHVGARAPGLMAYRAHIENLCGHHAHLCFDGGDPSKGLQLATLMGPPAPGKHVYVCGPRGLIDAVIATAKANGWEAEQVHFELFASTAQQTGDTGFQVELTESGMTLEVPPDKTILEVMIAAGLDPLYDCNRGECGVCAVDVIDGTPEHRDYCLSEEDHESNSSMCICVSRSTTPSLSLKA